MLDIINIMREKAILAMKNAHAPYSNFPVGACIRTEDDQFFTGCNVENISYPLGNCAESSAIAAMVLAGYKKIAEIVVVAEKLKVCPPCGGCRQRILEFSTENTLVHLCSMEKLEKTFTILELLPLAFTIK